MKSAMLWGASGGIGQAVMRVLQDANWQVVAIARQGGEWEQLAWQAIECDFSQPAPVQQAVLGSSQLVEQVDLWLYTAGDIAVA